MVAGQEVLGDVLMNGIFASLGNKIEPEDFEPRPGMLRVSALIVFRDESTMLDFAPTIKIQDGILRAVYHYDPVVAIAFWGAVSATDISRLLSTAGEFPGIEHASAELEIVETKPVTA